MTDIRKYRDEAVRYRGGHPEYGEHASATVELDDELLRVSISSASNPKPLLIPRGAVHHVEYHQERLGMEAAEYEEEEIIGPDGDLLRDVVIVFVKDAEGIRPNGHAVKLAFRNDYYAMVFQKRCVEWLHLPLF